MSYNGIEYPFFLGIKIHFSKIKHCFGAVREDSSDFFHNFGMLKFMFN